MKKIFYTILFYLIIAPAVFAQNILVESLTDFNANDDEKVFSAKVVEEAELSDGKIVRKDGELFVVVLSRKYKRLRIRKYFDELSNRRGSFDLVHCVDSMK